MNRIKRSVSCLLAAAILLCSLPLAATAEDGRLGVAVWEGMTLDDLIEQLNEGAGTDAEAEDWSYQTTGQLSYRYTKAEAYAGDILPSMNTWEDVTSYVKADPEAERKAIAGLAQKADQDEPLTLKMVSILGRTEQITPFVYQLPDKVSYNEYSARIRVYIEGTLTYPALNPAALPASARMECGGKSYTVTFSPARPVSLVQKDPAARYVIAVTGENPDPYALITDAVLNKEASVFGDWPFSLDAVSLSVIEGEEEIPVEEADVEAGVPCRLRLTYRGRVYTDSITFTAIFTDGRAFVEGAWSENGIEVPYTPSVQEMEQTVLDRLLTLKGDTEAVDPTELSLYYYGSFDYSSLLTCFLGDSLKKQVKEAILASYEPVEGGMSAEELAERYLNDESMASALRFDTWVPFGGGAYELCAEVDGRMLTLATLTLPAIGAGQWRVRAVHEGSGTVFPFTTESEEALLTVHPAVAEITSDGGGVTSSAPLTTLLVSTEEKRVYLSQPERYNLPVIIAGERKIDVGAMAASYLAAIPVDLLALMKLYRDEVLPVPLLKEALVGDTVLTSLFSLSYLAAFASYELSGDAPEKGTYLSLSVIGDGNHHADLHITAQSVGGAEGSCYLTLSPVFALSESEPSGDGQHYRLTFAAEGASMTPCYRGVSATLLSPDLPSDFLYDGLPHGEVLLEGDALAEGDVVRYYNLETGALCSSMPTEVGQYLVRIYHIGSQGATTERLVYRFAILPAQIGVTLPEVEMIWGDALPEIKPTFSHPVSPDYEIVLEGYEGKAGSYPISIRFPDGGGYDFEITKGLLTVLPRPLHLKVNDLTATYGDAIELSYSVLSGSIPSGVDLKLSYSEIPKNAGRYEIVLTSDEEGLALRCDAGTVVIERKKLTLSLVSQTLYFGQTPTFTTVPAWSDPDVEIEYSLEGYNERPGTYAIRASLSDDTNYDVTFTDASVTFKPISMLMVRPKETTAQWGDALVLTPECVVNDNGNQIQVSPIGLTFAYTVKNASGTVVDHTKPLPLGTYTVSVKVDGAGKSQYGQILTASGKLYVVPKQITVGLAQAEVIYGETYRPEEHLQSSAPLPSGIEIEYSLPTLDQVGEYPVELRLSGTVDTEHYVITVESGTVRVLPRPVTVTVTSGLSKYEGQDDPDMIWQIDGVLSGDTIGGAPARQAGEEVGIYAITLGTLAHPCYEITLAEAEFVILPDGATAIELLTPPAKTEYLRGEALSTEGITLSLLLQSGTSRPLALEDCTVSGYDPMHIGAQTVTLTYGLLSVTFEVMVEPDELIIADDRFLLSEEDVTLTVDSTSKPVTLSELLAALPEGYTAKLYQGDAEQDGGKRIGTGMTLTVLRGDTVCMTLTVIHRGDVNGDGRLTQTDAVIILRALVGKYTLSEAGAIAADVVGIGRLTQTDAVQILRWVLSYDRA